MHNIAAELLSQITPPRIKPSRVHRLYDDAWTEDDKAKFKAIRQVESQKHMANILAEIKRAGRYVHVKSFYKKVGLTPTSAIAYCLVLRKEGKLAYDDRVQHYGVWGLPSYPLLPEHELIERAHIHRYGTPPKKRD